MNLNNNLISVGTKFNLFDSFKLKGVECASLFESFPNGLGYVVAIFLSNMSKLEKEAMQYSKISIRILENKNEFLLTVIKFEDTDLIFELSFDPSAYDDRRAMQLAETNNKLYVVGIDSETLETQTAREITIPLKLANKWLSVWSNAYKVKGYKKEYNNWLQSLENYDVYELWDMATPIGYIDKIN